MSLTLILSTLNNKLISYNTKGKYSNKQILYLKNILLLKGLLYNVYIHNGPRAHLY